MIQVYWNTRTENFSVRSKESGLVIDHRGLVILEDPRLVVRPGGLARVRTTGRKNVHAWVEGWEIDLDDFQWADRLDCETYRITYNPKKEGAWVFRHSREPSPDPEFVWLQVNRVAGKDTPYVLGFF